MRVFCGSLFCLLVFGQMSLGNPEAFAQWNLWGGNSGNQSHNHNHNSGHSSSFGFGSNSGYHNEGGYRHRPDGPSNDLGTNIANLIIGGVDSAIRNGNNNKQHHHPRNNNNYYDDYYDQPRYQSVRPQYQPAPKPKPVPVKVKANTKPAERIVAPHVNQAPADAAFDLLDQETTEVAQNAVEEKAEKSVDDLKEKLGDAADDPAVKDKLEEIEDKIKNGEAVTQDELDDLLQTAEGTGKLPPGHDDRVLDGLADDVRELSEANEILADASNFNGIGGIPTGPTDVVFMPAWPADEVVILADGSIMVGTGGQGSVQTTTTDAQVLLDVPVGVGEPEPDSSGDVAKRVRDGVLLMNPESNGEEIQYVVANHNYSMKLGYTQRLSEGKTWVVTFDRGEGFGEASYTLSEGTYAFGPSSRGWELYSQKFSVTIDNVESNEDFYYNVDNVQHTIHGRDAETFKSSYPIYVQFDRGNGELALKKISEKSSTLQVAVNPDDSFWDLYPIESDLKVAKGSSKRSNTKSEKKSSKAEKLQKLLRLSNL